LTLITFANLGVRLWWARVTLYVLTAVVLVFYALTVGLAPVLLAVATTGALGAPDLGQLLAPALAALGLVRIVRGWMARFLPLDPSSPVHALALVLTLLLFTSQLFQQLTTDVVGREATSGSSLTQLDLVVQEVPFLLAAVAGVGLLVRRTPGQALNRLGYQLPSWWQVVAALAVTGVFFGLSSGVDYLSHALTPDLAHKVDAANERILGPLQTTLVGVLTIAVAAGICEEAIFRGALQPRLGIVYVSLLFAAVHTQYGLTLVALVPLLAGVGLGLLRKYANTSTSTICHVSYNALIGIYGLGNFSPWLVVGAEAVLVALLASRYTLSRRRRGSL
jgi:membrane protease YdiL (CAAX protease family)